MISALNDWPSRLVALFRSPRYLADLAVSIVVLVVLGWGYLYWFLAPVYGSLPPNPVTDRLLEFLPTVDLNYPSVVMILVDSLAFGLWVLFRVPEKAPFVLKVLTLVIFAKHLIGPMTNLTQPVGAINDSAHDNIYNDLFFSGHTGTLFTFYLLSRSSLPRLKWFFLCACLFEATVVLLMKLHYTIDVFAAPFIVYGLFVLANRYLGANKRAYEPLLPAGSSVGGIA